MGSGYWSSDVYETAERLRKGASAFGYSASGARTVHPSLDPFDVGKRESRDLAVAEILRAPVAIRSHGPGRESKRACPLAAISR
jgi:hypothetical protein